MSLVTETVTINSAQYKRTYSDSSYYIQDSSGNLYVDAVDSLSSTNSYTETTTSIPTSYILKQFENKLTTQLSTKADLDLSNTSVPYIIESYVEGTEGYIVYSNNYCEQWGYISKPVNTGSAITFLKPFKDTNYAIFASATGSSTGTSVSNRRAAMAWPYSNTTGYAASMSGSSESTTSVFWHACGYIE